MSRNYQHNSIRGVGVRKIGMSIQKKKKSFPLGFLAKFIFITSVFGSIFFLITSHSNIEQRKIEIDITEKVFSGDFTE